MGLFSRKLTENGKWLDKYPFDPILILLLIICKISFLLFSSLRGSSTARQHNGQYWSVWNHNHGQRSRITQTTTTIHMFERYSMCSLQPCKKYCLLINGRKRRKYGKRNVQYSNYYYRAFWHVNWIEHVKCEWAFEWKSNKEKCMINWRCMKKICIWIFPLECQTQKIGNWILWLKWLHRIFKYYSPPITK